MRRIVLAAALLAATVAMVEASELRTFKLAHRQASEAVALVAPLLSAEGSVVLQPQHNTLLVRDNPEVVERVAALLARWDLPPSVYRVEIDVLLASNVEPTPAPRPGPHFRPGLEAYMGPTPTPRGPHFRSVREELPRFFRYRYFTDLETLHITAADGERVEAPAAQRYYVRFTLRALPWNRDRVRLAGLELLRRRAEGDEVGQLLPLLRATVSLRMRQLSVIGTARSEDAEQALVLVFRAEREETQ